MTHREARWVLGDHYLFHATGETTNGAFFLAEATTRPSPQPGPPPHIHDSCDESFFILDGEFEFLLGSIRSRLNSGGFVHVPRGTVHTFRNLRAALGKMLVLITPAGLEDFFREVGLPAEGPLMEFPEVSSNDIERVMNALPKYGMRLAQ